MELDSRGFHRLETPRKDLPQAIVDGKGTPVLNDDMAKFAKRAPFFEPEHFERHLTNEPFRHGPGEIGKVRFGHLIIEGLVGDRRTKEGIEAAVEIGNGLDGYALKAGQLTYDCRYSTMHGMTVTGGRGF